MWSFICIIGLLFLSSTCNARFDTVKKKYSYSSDYEIILDEQAIKDSSLVYSACILDEYRKELNCSIALRSFSDAKTINELTCQSNYIVPERFQKVSRQFQLKKLFNNLVVFVWKDEVENDPTYQHLYLSIINMTSCFRRNYGFKTKIEEFHIVVYEDTFDIYYPNEKCGDFLCGETYDDKGRLINGPIPTYLPNEYFYNNTRMCSVKADASSKGQYVITPNTFNLISSYYGKKMEMGVVPFDARVAAYDCSKEYLGYCWLPHNKHIINCEQFNAKGRRILSTVENLNYDPGMWMSMKNLGPSELLIVNNECSGLDSCTGNIEHVKFHVLKKPADSDKAFDVHQLSGLECENVTNIRSEVIQKEDGRICVTLACHTVTPIESKFAGSKNNSSVMEKGSQSINFLSTCFLK